MGDFQACDRALDAPLKDDPLLPVVGRFNTHLDLLAYPKVAGFVAEMQRRIEAMRSRIRAPERVHG